MAVWLWNPWSVSWRECSAAIAGRSSVNIHVRDRIAGAIGFIVGSLVLISWISAGFAELSLVWKLGLGIPFLLVLVDYGMLMIGKGSLFARIARFLSGRRDRDRGPPPRSSCPHRCCGTRTVDTQVQ